MPSKELLLEALAFCLQWIRINFWDTQLKLNTENIQLSNKEPSQAYSEIHNALDCYRYLKIYTIWGGVSVVGDLKDQDELYQHVAGLLQSHGSVRKRFRNDVDRINIREASNIARGSIHSFLSSLNADKTESLIQNLVHDEMMVPSKEFLLSLCSEDETKEWSNKSLLLSEKRTKVLPENLVKMWSDVLQMMSSCQSENLIFKLVLEFHKLSAGNDIYDRTLAASWIVEILGSVYHCLGKDPTKSEPTGKKRRKTSTKVQSAKSCRDILKFSPKDINQIELERCCLHVVEEPLSAQTLGFLPFVLEPLNLTEKKKAQIEVLIATLYGLKSGSNSLDNSSTSGFKTLDDLNGTKLTQVLDPDNKWSLADDVKWDTLPFGLCPNQDDPPKLHVELNCVENLSENMNFLKEFDRSDIVKVEWDDLERKKLSAKHSLSMNSSTSVSDISEEEDAVFIKSKSLKLAAKEVPAFYRSSVIQQRKPKKRKRFTE